MSNRYEVIPDWTTERTNTETGLAIQHAPLKDTRTGDVYPHGAYRVVNLNERDAKGRVKPAKVGKGGTVPFKGETAWSDAERLYGDLVWAARRAR